MNVPPPLPPTPAYPPAQVPAGSTVGFAFAGIGMTIGLAAVVFLLAMFLMTALHVDNVFVFNGFNWLAVVIVGLPIALRLRGKPKTRGWATGIFIGLGLVTLAWAFFTFIVLIFVIGTPSHR